MRDSMISIPTDMRRAHPGDAEAILLAHLDSIRSIGARFYSPEIVDAWAAGLTPEVYVHAMEGGEALGDPTATATRRALPQAIAPVSGSGYILRPPPESGWRISMMRRALIVLGMLAVSTGAFAQSQEEIDTALLAAPANLREGATVIKWKPDFTYDTLRKGTNRLVCFDKSGLPGQLPFSIECSSIGNMDRIVQNMKFEAEPDRAKRQAALDAAEKDGTRAKPEYGSVWYHLMGKSRDTARTHMTVALPFATAQSTGLPDNAKMGGAWVMNAGTSSAHLMIPGE